MLAPWDQLHNELKDLPLASLLPRLQMDQIQRWKAHQPLLVEEYLQHFPELQHSTESVLVLILGEVLQREAHAQPVHEQEYLNRFPAYREPLRMQLAFHQAMGQKTSMPLTGTGEQQTDTKPRDLTGLIIAEKYKLRELVGEGGMGTVWRAEQLHPVKRQVAIKLIKPGMDSKAVLTRFEAERQALAIMDHPNIARVLDGGATAQNEPYFVMELVKGVTITEYCDACKLTPRARLELFLPVCEAIQHAHQKGIIHRDIKPSNVLVALYDEKAVPKVIDFGVAKATETPLTEATLETGIGAVLGTLEYMSPEQASLNNLDIDTRSDIYSLGVLLYELLAGSPPFQREQLRQVGLLEILRKIREDEPPRPSTKLSTAEALPTISANRGTEPRKLTGLLRNELDWIVMKALEKNRSRRYESASSLASDLQRYLAGEPVLAHPPSAIYRLRKLIRQRRGVFIAAGLIITALVAGIVGTTWGLFKAEQSRVEAEDHAVKARAAALSEKQAREQESLQRQRSEKAWERALQALDAMTSNLAQESLGTQRELTPQQTQFLNEAIKYYQEFATQQSDDRFSRGKVAHAAFALGLLRCRLNQQQQGMELMNTSQAQYSSLREEFPDDPVYWQGEATCHYNVSLLMSQQLKMANALTESEKAVRLYQHLTKEFPSLPAEYHREGLKYLVHHADLVQNRGQQQESDKLYQQALDVATQQAKAEASSRLNQLSLAWMLNKIGSHAKGLGRSKEARQYYQSALDILRQQQNIQPDDLRCQQTLANSLSDFGLFLSDLSLQDEAKLHLDESLSISQKVIASYPLMSDFLEIESRTHLNLGVMLMRQGQPEAALEEHRRATAIRLQLATLYPAVTEYQRSLAKSYSNLGVQLINLRRREEAERAFREGMRIREVLYKLAPKQRESMYELSESYNNLGNLLNELGKKEESLKLQTQAIQLREQLVKEFPEMLQYQIALAGSYSNIANLQTPEGSLPYYEKAIALLKPLLQKQPTLNTARRFLCNSLENQGNAYFHLAQYSTAILSYNQAIGLAPTALQGDYRLQRAKCFLMTEEYQRTWQEVQELAQLSKWKPEGWYDLARLCILSGSKLGDQAKSVNDQTLSLLNKARQAGFQDLNRLKKDKALDPLRELEPFKKLMNEISTK